MSKQKNEFAPQEIGRQRVQLLETRTELIDAEVIAELVPITGGINIDRKLVNHEKSNVKQ